MSSYTDISIKAFNQVFVRMYCSASKHSIKQYNFAVIIYIILYYTLKHISVLLVDLLKTHIIVYLHLLYVIHHY